MGERAAWPGAAMLSPSPVSPLPHRGSAPTRATLGNIPVCQVLTHPRPLFPSPGPGGCERQVLCVESGSPEFQS